MPKIKTHKKKYGFKTQKVAIVPYRKSAYDKQIFKKISTKPEFKYIDNNTTSELSTTGVFFLLSGCQQGDTQITRSGAKFNMKSIQMNIKLSTPASNSSSQIIRLILFVHKQARGTAPSIAHLLESEQVYTMKSKEHKEWFTIIKDKRVVLSQNGTSGDLKFIKWYKKMNIQANHSLANAGDITDVAENALYLYVLSDVNLADDRSDITFSSRLWFQDP